MSSAFTQRSQRVPLLVCKGEIVDELMICRASADKRVHPSPLLSQLQAKFGNSILTEVIAEKQLRGIGASRFAQNFTSRTSEVTVSEIVCQNKAGHRSRYLSDSDVSANRPKKRHLRWNQHSRLVQFPA